MWRTIALTGFGGVLVGAVAAYAFLFASREERSDGRFKLAAEMPLAAVSALGTKGAGNGSRAADSGVFSPRQRKEPGSAQGGAMPKDDASPPRQADAVPFLREESPLLREPSSRVCEFGASEIPRRTRVIINEIAWMGMTDAGDEWIEFKNIGASSVNLRGWQFMDQAGQIHFTFENDSAFAPGDLLLARRASGGALIGRNPDVVYAGALGNEKESLRLFDAACGLEDEASASPAWPAGEHATKKTMERDSGGFGWHTSLAAGGTPGSGNSSPVSPQSSAAPPASPQPPPPLVPPPPPPAREPTPAPPPVPPSPPSASASNVNHVLIGEVQVAGVDAGDEFVELYNPTDAAVDLSGWSVQYVSGNATSTEAAAKKNFVGGQRHSGARFLSRCPGEKCERCRWLYWYGCRRPCASEFQHVGSCRGRQGVPRQ